MRLLVTGATGFVGTRLTAELVAEGHHVAGTYVGDPPAEAGFEPLPADIADAAAVDGIVDAAAPEAVIHLAGLSHVGASWSHVSDYFRVNVLGTRNILRAAQGVPIIVASSAEVYGVVPESDQPIREAEPVDPRSPYAMSKAAAELLAAESGAIIVRSFNLIGPGQSTDFALPSFSRQLAEIAAGQREPVLRVGNLAARRDFLHVDDAVAAYRDLITKGRAGEIYNLGTGRSRSIRETLDLLLEVSQVEVRTETDPERFRPVDVPMTCADIGRITALGWSPRRTVREALAALWQAALEDVEAG